MTQTKQVHRLTIRDKDVSEGRITTGIRTEVLLDDKPLKGVHFVKFEVKAGSVVKILMELYCTLDVDVNVSEETMERKIKNGN